MLCNLVQHTLLVSGIIDNNKNNNNYNNSMDFTKQVANQEIAEDEVMVSFDVVSLFTAIPIDKACVYIREKLDEDTKLHSRTKLNADEIISLLDFTLSNNYFMFNDSVYKQIHGCGMGSPVSPVVANLYMEVIEEGSNRRFDNTAKSLETLRRRQFCHNQGTLRKYVP